MYYEIRCKDMELSDSINMLVHEKLGLLEHLINDYPPESVMAKVTLQRLPVTDEFYHVRVLVELPGDRLYSRASGGGLETALVDVAGDLERQLQHLLSDRRNEIHWKRLSHPAESVRRTVPVDEDEIKDIAEEIQRRTEERLARERRRRAA